MAKKDKYKQYKTYAENVLKGKIVACEFIKLACKRYLEWFDKKDRYFDEEGVKRCINFIGHLKHSSEDFTNKPFILSDFQEFAIYNIYGWRWKSNNLRIIKNVYVEIARKNGKSQFAAAIACYELLKCQSVKGEQGSEVEFIASNRKQAGICFDMAKKLLKTLGLNNAKYFKFYRDKVDFKPSQSFLQVLSADGDSNDGWNSNCFICDEYHTHSNSCKIYNVMKSSQNFRREPLAIVITTAGHSITSDCYKMHNYCIDVLKGKIEDETQFSMIFNLDEGDDWQDETVWKKTNPNLGITVRLDNLRDEVNRAKNSPSFEVEAKTKYFNIWCNTKEVWLPTDVIEKSSQPVNLEDFRGMYATGGLDLAVTRDLTAFSIMIENNSVYYFKTWYYLPKTALNNNANSELYKQWANQGYLTVTPSNTTDYDFILRDILKLNNDYEIVYKTIGYDQFNASYFAIKASEESLPLVPFSQAIWNFNKPTKEFERLILGNQVVIDKNPITLWCFNNVNIKTDHNENIKPVKENLSSPNKIDGVISTLMALGTELAISNPTPALYI